MLLRFRTANVRSLRDEQELSFVVSGDDEGEPSEAARPVELAGGQTVGVLPWSASSAPMPPASRTCSPP